VGVVGSASDGPTLALLAEVTRSGLVESVHHGSVVVVGADGRTVVALGTPDVAVYGRSANKPVQAAAMVRAGLDLSPEHLVLVCASHSGQPEHVAGVLAILQRHGLSERDLQNTAALPLDAEAARAADGPSPLLQNCSGKHAGMLATCVVNGWSLEGYLDPAHPLQAWITATFADLAAEDLDRVGVDGCGAPVHAVTLRGLATAFQSLALAPTGSPDGRVAEAMRQHPFLLGGRGRDVTAVAEAVPGLVVKDGAEGVVAAATLDGAAVAVKVADGASRAWRPVLVEALRAAGVAAPGLDVLRTTPVLGHGRPVGEVRAVSLASHRPAVR
jgi:L-asparaginase II